MTDNTIKSNDTSQNQEYINITDIKNSTKKNRLDMSTFNKEYDIKKSTDHMIQKENATERLNLYNDIINSTNSDLVSQSFTKIMIGIRDTFFDIYNDLFNNQKPIIDIFFEYGRLFYVGVFIVIISVILFLCSSFEE